MGRAQLAVVENPFDGAERALGALTERLRGLGDVGPAPAHSPAERAIRAA